MMFQSAELGDLQFWAAQILVAQEVVSSGEAVLTLSGSQGFLVLIAGIVLAFAFQLLLTNFFIALGILYSSHQSDTHSNNDADSLDDTINKIGTLVGLQTLGTISITLFIACFLAVRLSLVHHAILGAILGLVIWAAYLNLLIWVSSTTVSSVIDTVFSTATSGLQGIIGTAAIAIGAKNVSDQVVSTAETAATAIREELSLAVDSVSDRQAIDNYLQRLRLPEEDRKEIRDEFEKLVAKPEMQSIAKENHLRNISRQTFVDVVNSRTDFSKQNINQVVAQFEAFWQQIWGQEQPKSSDNGLLNYLKPAHPEKISSQLTPQLEELIEATRIQASAAVTKGGGNCRRWLFGTAFVSATASAIAGTMAVRS